MKAMLSIDKLYELRQRSLREIGYDMPQEGDWHFNKLNRAMVRAVRREHGEACIYAVNGTYSDKEKVAWSYVGGMLWNFQGSFVLPFYDEALEGMIRSRLATPYTTTASDAKLVDAIFERAMNLGAITFQWV